mmetsp:Transcript_3911/g.6540  ORF Transcript_3911/g.6540 Transcript_3911/m.6540 type:complete len:91 (+) Transcript_3911:179-451(+)
MASCARRVFPEKVIAQVSVETAKIRGHEPVPPNMLLKGSLERSRLKDSTMVELTVDNNVVKETDILKGREVFKRHQGKLGTMVLVVRRPG